MTWLYLPSNCAAASACLEKDCEPGSPTWASRLAPVSTLSGKLTQPQSWLRAWKKAAWMRHLSGATFAPSTLSLGVAKWIASLPDSRARTLALPAGAQGSTASGPACSSKSSGSQPIAVRGSCFWRTSQASFLPPPPLWTKPKANLTNARPPESWENWPTAGGTRNGSLFLRPMWVPATAGRGGSASRGETWPTPNTMPNAPNSGLNRGNGVIRARHKSQSIGLTAENWATPDCNTASYSNGKFGPNIRQQSAQWMTPNVPNGGRHVPEELVASKGMTAAGQKMTVGLESQSKYWTTPSASDGERGGCLTENMSGTSLTQQVKSIWSTPKASEMDRGICPSELRRNSAALLVQTAQWPTPAARDHKGTNSEEHALVTGGGRKHMDQLANFVAYSPLAQATRDGETSLTNSLKSPRHLNPLFGAWLMGWPSTWAIAEPHASSASETVLWRSMLQSQLSCLLDEPEYSKEAA